MSIIHVPARHDLRGSAGRAGALIVGAVLSLGACASLRAPNASAAAGAAAAPAGAAPVLHETAGHYVLDRPLEDFYDSDFVFTDGGKGPPRPETLSQIADALVADDVVVFGENHAHAGIHLDEMQLFRALYARDHRWVLSLEQFERDTQEVVDQYLAGKIGEDALIERARAWPNYASSYRPLLLFARDHHLPVVAAEAPGWAVSCVGQLGTEVLEKFTPAERAWVAKDIHTMPGPYRDRYMGFLGGSPAHGDDKSKAERSFAAQVTRDDTMAESIAQALHDHPGYKVLHVTGHFHSEGFLGTVERLRLRVPGIKVAVVQPVEVDDPAKPSFSKAETADGTVLELVYPTPDEFIDGEDTSAVAAHIRHEHAVNHCKYGPAPAAAAPTGWLRTGVDDKMPG